MKILSVKASNFASYKDLEFTFDNQGLTLFSGQTGSGKSTLCDLVPWGLFGITAKNGSVDEVVSWGTDATTYVHVILDMENYSLWIARTRNPNDLYYVIDGVWEHPKRGKDLADTQKQINQLLGIDAETYLAGAYYHEFSPTAQFFNTTAKNRRNTTEQLADLSLANSLTAKISLHNKEIKKEIDDLANNLMLKQNTLNQLEKSLANNKLKSKDWTQKHNYQLSEVENKFLNYEDIKTQIIQTLTNKRIAFDQDVEAKSTNIKQDIKIVKQSIKSGSYFLVQEEVLNKRLTSLGDSKCKECGGPKNSHKHQVLTKDSYALEKAKAENERQIIWILSQENSLKQLESRINPYKEQIENEKVRENTYLVQLTALNEETDPFKNSIEELKEGVISEVADIADIEYELSGLKVDQSDLELLTQVINDFRGVVISNTVDYLEQSTNLYLERFFDAEIRVGFNIEASDKLDVVIYKDGNTCSFTQLSKGQRQLLKLCFALSVMSSVSNHAGVDFNCIFLDECTDGLDEEMKLKAFNLLSSLEEKYSSIFLVEHSEGLKSCFTNRYDVELINGMSQIEKS